MGDLRAMLIRHEGLRTKPYKCTAGFLTIGVGRNLDTRGITTEEALFLLDSDIVAFTDEIRRKWPWMTEQLDGPRFDAVVDMVFNLGIAGLERFARFLAALYATDYTLAAAEMLNSRWAGQVGDRARELAAMIQTGQYQTEERPHAAADPRFQF